MDLNSFKKIVDIAVSEKASDILMSVGQYPTIRVDGQLAPLTGNKKISPEDSMNLALKLIGEHKKNKLIEEKDIDFSYSFDDFENFCSFGHTMSAACDHIPRSDDRRYR